MIIDIKDAVFELKDHILDHFSLAFLFTLVGVGVGLLYPESQLLMTYFRTYSIYFNADNISFFICYNGCKFHSNVFIYFNNFEIAWKRPRWIFVFEYITIAFSS